MLLALEPRLLRMLLKLLRLRVRGRTSRANLRLVRPRASRCNPWPLRRGGLPLPHIGIPPLFLTPSLGPLAALLMVCGMIIFPTHGAQLG